MFTAFTQARCIRYGLLGVVLVTVAACGGSKNSGAATSAATTASATVAATTTASSTTATSTTATSTTEVATSSDQTSSSAAGSACAPSATVLAAAKLFPEITTVSLIGGCGQVSAATTLAPGALGSPSVTRAITMCTAISKVAYVGSVYSVSIDGKDGHELATSTKGQPCI